ncbi:MAG TPA: aldo/keto reductase [Acidimicrobiales bacterium]|nr:aldo/keto reductase [Acidimicrobiales bacterium]
MEAFSSVLPVETLQPPYHLFQRVIEEQTLPSAAAHDSGVLAYGPLAHGLLGGHLREETRFAPGDRRASSAEFHGGRCRQNLAVGDELGKIAIDLVVSLGQLATAWVPSNPAVDVAIVGTRDPNHVSEAVGAADLQLDGAWLERIERAVVDAVLV